MTQSITSFEHFDSVAMNMVSVFNELVSIAAKADTVDALLAIKEQLDSMAIQLDSSIDSYKDSALAVVDSQNPIDSSDDSRKPFDSAAVAYIKKQLTRINIITNSIADNVDGVKRMDKKT